MIMIKILYSARTIKYSKALNIQLQLKKMPKKLISTIIILKKIYAMLKSKKEKSKILYKIKLNFRVILINDKLS